MAEKPTLILWGDKDYYIAPDFAEKWGKHGAKVVRFADYGHWLAVENPAEYAKHLEAFISGE
jgi:pimeloyl-ACP methyl ester carboxylesterase